MQKPLFSTPDLSHVDLDIFELRYHSACMQCTYCFDSCCQYGCDVNLGEKDRILALKEELVPFLRIPESEWFLPEVYVDPEYPSGRFVRSAKRNGACVFRSEAGRGCALHRFALATGRDYHDVKPMVCWLFPVCWDQGVLRPSSDIRDDLMCRGRGPTIYESVRNEIRHVFGDALIDELDALAPASIRASILAVSQLASTSPAKSSKNAEPRR